MAIDRTGIDSLNRELDVGASAITYSGNQGPQDPRAMTDIDKIIMQHWLQQGGSYGDDIPEAFKQEIIRIYGLDRNRSAYGGTARPTYTQSRKQRMAGGGIAGLKNRPGYFLGGIGDWLGDVKDKIVDDLIPNELKNPATLAGLVGLGANYKDLIPGDMSSEGWIGDLLGGASDMITGSAANKELERVIGGYPNPDLDPTTLPSEGFSWDKALATILPGGDPGYVEGGLYNALLGLGGDTQPDAQGRYPINWKGPLTIGTTIGLADYLSRDKTPFPMDQTGIKFQTAQQAMADPELRFKPQAQYANVAEGGRIGFDNGGSTWREFLEDKDVFVDPRDKSWKDTYYRWLDKQKNKAQGGRIRAQEGGLMDLGGMEKDYREEGGFVPIGGQEKADDVPARLSKNEFVFTADAVRAAGGGDIDRGAEIMENLMENLEAGGKVSEESQGLEGARNMFANAQQLEKRII